MDLGLIAPAAVKIHLATVLPAFAVGRWLNFFSAKGRLPHRILGACYLALMTATAAAGLLDLLSR
jgi:uncharacterized membrane protein